MSHQPQANAALRARAEHAAKYGAHIVIDARELLSLLNQLDHSAKEKQRP